MLCGKLMAALDSKVHLLLVPDKIGLHAALRLEPIPQLISWVHSLVKVSRQVEGHECLWIALNRRHQSGLWHRLSLGGEIRQHLRLWW